MYNGIYKVYIIYTKLCLGSVILRRGDNNKNNNFFLLYKLQGHNALVVGRD